MEGNSRFDKAVINGDYVRLSNDFGFITIYTRRDPKNSTYYAQSYQNSQDYKYNHLHTLFQIIECPKKTNDLPVGDIVRPDEEEAEHRYLIMHVVSGRFLCVDPNGAFELRPIKSIDEADKFKFETEGSVKFIQKGGGLKIRDQNTGKLLCTGENIQMPNRQLDFNTLYVFGFVIPDDYLNKHLRPVRYTFITGDGKEPAEKLTFKLSDVKTEDLKALLLVESFTNQLQYFMDFLYDFIFEEKKPIKDLNREVAVLKDLAIDFTKRMYEEGYDEENEDALTPNRAIQHYLREFRVLGLM